MAFIPLDLAHELKMEQNFFFFFPQRSIKLDRPWLLIAALVKITKPIEGAKAAQMGLVDTDSLQRNSQILGEGLKVTLVYGIWGCRRKEAKDQ